MTVWVTGASSGLGLYTARALRDAGHQVIAGARSFTAGHAEGIDRLPLDVTSEESIDAFCQAALAISPRVDALVQCAGVLVLGSCEETSLEEYRWVMDTDFFGMVRMNRRVLPLMREAGGGKIVLFSSINGLLGVPFQSAYTAAKHAIEGYAECLAMECRPFGVQACLVEPGDHRGGSRAYRAHAAGMGEQSPYRDGFLMATSRIDRDEQGGSDPMRLGRKVSRVLKRRRMPFRLRVASPDQHLAVFLHDGPPCLHFKVLRDYYLGGWHKSGPDAGKFR